MLLEITTDFQKEVTPVHKKIFKADYPITFINCVISEFLMKLRVNGKVTQCHPTYLKKKHLPLRKIKRNQKTF